MSSGSERAAPGQAGAGRGVPRPEPPEGTPRTPTGSARGQRFQPSPALGRGGAEAPGAKGPLASLRPRRRSIPPLGRMRVRNKNLLAGAGAHHQAHDPGAGAQAAAMPPAILGAEPGGSPKLGCPPQGRGPGGSSPKFHPARAKQIKAKPSAASPDEGGTQAGRATAPICGRGHVPAARSGRAPREGARSGAGAWLVGEILHVQPQPNEKSCNLLRFPLPQSSLAR